MRQEQFVIEYLVDYNGAQAAIRAGYSVKAAKEQAHHLLTLIHIQAALRARKAELDKLNEYRIMGPYETLAKLTAIANGDMGDLLTKNDQGEAVDDFESISLRRAKKMGKSHLIKKIRQKTTYMTGDGVDTQIVENEVEMYSAHEALRDLGKYHVLFTDKHQFNLTPADVAKMSDEELMKLLGDGS